MGNSYSSGYSCTRDGAKYSIIGRRVGGGSGHSVTKMFNEMKYINTKFLDGCCSRERQFERHVSYTDAIEKKVHFEKVYSFSFSRNLR